MDKKQWGALGSPHFIRESVLKPRTNNGSVGLIEFNPSFRNISKAPLHTALLYRGMDETLHEYQLACNFPSKVKRSLARTVDAVITSPAELKAMQSVLSRLLAAW